MIEIIPYHPVPVPVCSGSRNPDDLGLGAVVVDVRLTPGVPVTSRDPADTGRIPDGVPDIVTSWANRMSGK
jgi:hypothetical protein